MTKAVKKITLPKTRGSWKFKSPRELDITANEHKWLLAAADQLYVMLPEQRVKIPNDGIFKFDMATVRSTLFKGTEECGTAGCIFGLCRVLSLAAKDDTTWFDARFEKSGHDAGINPLNWSYRYSNVLHRLFYPHVTDAGYDKVTPRIAANATYRFLRTGRIRFPKRIK